MALTFEEFKSKLANGTYSRAGALRAFKKALNFTDDQKRACDRLVTQKFGTEKPAPVPRKPKAEKAVEAAPKKRGRPRATPVEAVAPKRVSKRAPAVPSESERLAIWATLTTTLHDAAKTLEIARTSVDAKLLVQGMNQISHHLVHGMDKFFGPLPQGANGQTEQYVEPAADVQ